MRSYRIYVPAPGPLSRSTIWPGSGIVGEAVSPTQLEIYYEGNLYGAINMRTWADRVYQAAARRRERAPTVARMIVRRDDYVAVGTIDMSSRTVRLRPEAAALVCEWLEVDALDPAELPPSDGRTRP